MIHIDSKVTEWQRFSIAEEHREELLEFLTQNPKADARDIILWAEGQGIDGEHETLCDTDRYLTPAENGGEATLEVFQDMPASGSEELWTNKPKTKDEHGDN